MPIPFAVIGAAIGVASLVSGRADAKKAGKKEKEIGALNARIERLNAASASLERTERLSQALQSQKVEFAGRGLDVGSGSILAQGKSDFAKYQLESKLAKYSSDLQAQAYKKGAQARASAMTSSANQSLLSGIGSLAMSYGQTRT